MDKSVYVIYIGVAGIRTEDIGDYVNKITSKIIPSSIEGEFIIIPQQSTNSRFECINPKYITEQELIDEHNKLLRELNDKLEEQKNILQNGTESE